MPLTRRPVFGDEHPVTLALLRIVVCLVVLVSPEVRHVRVNATAPVALRVIPEGLGWFFARIPITDGLAFVAQLGIALGAFAALIGYRTQQAMAAVAFFGFYAFALAQLSGAVTHDMHLVWFAALLAVSPCGDALTLFAGSRYRRSRAYAAPLVFVRALLSAVYFFPGAWKLRESGLAWALSDNLRNQMYLKWFEWGGWLPLVRVDAHPILLRAMGLSVLAFELSFPLLMLTRRTRVVAAIVGIAFHLSSAALLRIHFPSLFLCYVALIDFGPLADRGAERRGDHWAPSAEPRTRAPSPWPIAVGAALLVGAVVQGVRGATFAWPFACYPTFQSIAGSTLPDLVLESEFSDGRVVVVDSGGNGRGRSQDGWARAWSLAGVTHGSASRDALLAYWNAHARADARGAVRGRAVRVVWSAVPADRDRAPLARDVLESFEIDPASGAAR